MLFAFRDRGGEPRKKVKIEAKLKKTLSLTFMPRRPLGKTDSSMDSGIEEGKVSISPTNYEQLFCVKVKHASFCASLCFLGARIRTEKLVFKCW